MILTISSFSKGLDTLEDILGYRMFLSSGMGKDGYKFVTSKETRIALDGTVIWNGVFNGILGLEFNFIWEGFCEPFTEYVILLRHYTGSSWQDGCLGVSALITLNKILLTLREQILIHRYYAVPFQAILIIDSISSDHIKQRPLKFTSILQNYYKGIPKNLIVVYKIINFIKSLIL